MVFVCVQIVVKPVDVGIRGGLADGSGGWVRDGKIRTIITPMTKYTNVDLRNLVIGCAMLTQSPFPQKQFDRGTPKTPL